MAQQGGRRFSSRYAATPYAARQARHAVAAFARACGLLDAETADLETALGEAVTNAIEHGNKMQGSFEVSAVFEAGRMVVEVRDAGDGFTETRLADPGGRGWGITLMRALVDEVSFHEGGRCVRLCKRSSTSQ